MRTSQRSKTVQLALLFAIAGQLASADQPAAARSVTATRVESAPRLDGTLDDPRWARASAISDFRQRDPQPGRPATNRSEVRIVYTESAIYFGVRCASRSGVIARELRRDVVQDADDYFEIMIDPRRDRRSAYVFQVNPLGTQRDGIIVEERGADDGSDFDSGWDGVWTSEARMSASGWTATVEIPFSTLNITRVGVLAWGVNFKRFTRANSEEDLWSAYEREYGITKVSQAGELRGIELGHSDRLFVLKPYGLLGARSNSNGGWRADYAGGLDAKYGVDANTILNVTLNTDFADSDIDLVQFNLTPYALFLPEKRQFFLENQGTFDFFTGLQERLFYTRQIGIDTATGQVVPIDAGVKLVSKPGGFEIGFMDVKTRSSSTYPSTNIAVARIKRSLPGGSYIGAIGIDKRTSASGYNQSAGLDTRLNLRSNLVLYAWSAMTRSPGVRSRQSNLGGNSRYSTSWFSVLAQHFRVGANYNPEVGFVGELGAKKTYVDTNFRKRLGGGRLRELSAEPWVYYVSSTTGYLMTKEWAISSRLRFDNGGYIDITPADSTVQTLTSPFQIYKHVAILPGVYKFNRPQIVFASAQDKSFTFRVSDKSGGFYGGNLNELALQASYRPSRHLVLTASGTWNRVSLPAARFSVVLASFQTTYSFSRAVSLGTLVQVNTADTQAVSSSVRLRYNYRPDSDLYLIFTAGPTYLSSTGNGLGPRQTKLAVKLTRSFSPHWLRKKQQQRGGLLP